jgi:hypothetical protein
MVRSKLGANALSGLSSIESIHLRDNRMRNLFLAIATATPLFVTTALADTARAQDDAAFAEAQAREAQARADKAEAEAREAKARADKAEAEAREQAAQGRGPQ